MWRRLSSLLSRRIGGRRGGRGPDVLWICADDYAAYVSGAYGNPSARTPNLDRLAAGGIRFDRSYCASPLSTPSRMAFLTGRYPRSVGVTLSPTPLPRSEATIGSLLRAAGYAAIAVGKTHYYDPLGREFDRCIDRPEYEAWLAGRGLETPPRDVEARGPWRPFDSRPAAQEPNPSVDPLVREALLAAIPPEPVPSGVEVLGPWLPFADPAAVWLNADCLPYARDAEMPDTFFTDAAADLLGQERSSPLFLSVGFYVTHSPFRFPVEMRGRFDPAAFAVPEVTPEDRDAVPEVFRDLTDGQKRGIIAAYYASVEYMDRNLGLILDALDRSGRADDTLIIFHSDHGYLLGQHGRFEKHCCHEEAVRTSLVMRLPGVIAAGRATGAMVELIDLVPTVLDLCGVDIPANVQGRSLVPLLMGRVDHHRDHVIAEYADNAEAMVRTGRWKLIYTAGNRRRRDGYAFGDGLPGRSTRLYDLVDDPGETRDLADRPEHAGRIGELLAILADHLRRTARDPGQVPATDDVYLLLDRCLTPTEARR